MHTLYIHAANNVLLYIIYMFICAPHPIHRIYHRFIIDRNTNVQSFKSKLDELNEISSLGGGVVGTTTRTRPHPAFVHPAAGAAVAAQAAPLTQSGSPVQPFGPYAKSPANR